MKIFLILIPLNSLGLVGSMQIFQLLSFDGNLGQGLHADISDAHS